MSDKRSSNQSENDKFNNAANAAGLSRDEKDRLHRQLENDPEKDGKTFKELKELAEELKKK